MSSQVVLVLEGAPVETVPLYVPVVTVEATGEVILEGDAEAAADAGEGDEGG